jgi:Xaa-Pro aminopeptidase
MNQPHFSAEFFAGNRKKLLGELNHGALVMLAGYGQMQRGSDSAYHFEQEANFWYLTGIEHPDWWLLIDGSQGRSWLICPEIDEVRQIFDGSLSPEAARVISGVDAVIDRTEARRMLSTLRRQHSVIYSLMPQAELSRYGFYPNPAPKELIDELRTFQVQDCRLELSRLRAVKQPIEIDAMQAAVDLTIDGFKRAFKEMPKLSHEYEVEALFTHEFRHRGAKGHAYDPIVASDGNACTLHYVANEDSFTKKSWLLCDIGARHHGYAADITRTFPVSKNYTKRQRAIYEAVERVHAFAICLCTAGQSVMEYHEAVEDKMMHELVGLRLAKSMDDEEALREFFPHAISHGLGVDVHDPLGRPVQFAPGMVLTVEPGIYVPSERFGVRIEDDILITEDGPRNLSAKLPTNLDKLLALLA